MTPSSPKSRPPNFRPIIIASVLLFGIGVLLTLWLRKSPQADSPVLPSAAASTVSGVPEREKVTALMPADETLEPAFWLDVLQPKAVHQALAENAWTNDVASKPIGRGFLGPWAVFFGTRGQDIGARFDGVVLKLFTEALLAEPYRVLWLTGEKSIRVPVLVVPQSGAVASSALSSLIAAAGKGGFSPQGCPGSSPDGGVADGGSLQPAPGLATIHRVLLGDHALFVAHVGDRLIMSGRPNAVLHGMCLKPFTLKTGENAVELGVSLDENGRALQGLAAILGVQGEAKLAFGIEGNGFGPRGIITTAARPGRLSGGALEESMLKLIPESTGVFVTLNLTLPKNLDNTSLERIFSGKSIEGATANRQVAVLWNPHGDAHLPSEFAVIWNRAEDESFLSSIVSKTHPLLQKRVCGQVVLASTEKQLKDIETSCGGAAPSVLAAAPAVAKELKDPSSIGLNVNLGGVLSTLILDGWFSEPKPLPAKSVPLSAPPEIEAARKQMETLPFLHWRAVVDEKGQLIAKGFRS